MSQSIIIPDKCTACHAQRLGMQEHVWYYGCGTTLKVTDGRAKVKRSNQCINGLRIHLVTPKVQTGEIS
jgi:hypothetical protein